MQRTIFAGLTVLDSSESIYTEGFLDRNPQTIDHFLELGALTHRHDEHPAVPNPVTPPTVVASASGGTIDPAVTGWFGYTIIDSDGGETAISTLASAATPEPFAPPNRPASGVAEYTGGTLRADTYYYGITLLDGLGGETTIGPYVTVTRDPGYASGQVRLSGLDVLMAESVGAVGYAVYRATGGQWAYLGSGAVAEFVDTGELCADCLREPPYTNTTRKTTKFIITVPVLASGEAFRLYGASTADLVSPALVGEYPIASGGVAIDLPSMVFEPGSPPPISLSKGGAGKIDLDSEVATPVATPLTLGAGVVQAGSGWASAAYSRGAGEVTLLGAVAGALASGTVIGTVPPGYRPAGRHAAVASVLTTPRDTVVLDVEPTGDIVLTADPGGPVFLDTRWRT